MRLWLLTAWIAAVTGLACSSTTQPDSGTGGDTNPMDIGVPNDGTPVTDGGASTDGASDVTDAASSDGGSTDAASGLAGVYRLTGLDSTSDAGTIHVDDTDTVIGAVHVRANGIMNLTAGSYAISLATAFGTTSPDHVPIDQQSVMQGMPRLAATGFGLAGTLDDAHDRFVGPTYMGMATTPTFTLNADGTVGNDAIAGLHFTWTRIISSAIPSATLTSNGVATSVPQTSGVYLAFAHPRVTIAWDNPNHGTGYTSSNDAAITLTGSPPVSAPYAMTFSGTPPSAAMTTVGSVPTALGYVIVYDDVDNNQSFSAATDPIRGISTIAIGWLGAGTPDSTFATSVVADMQITGYQTIVVHEYITATPAAVVTVTPLDPTHPINLDAPIYNTALPATDIPDLL